jgi:hypothetical protein
VRRAIEHYNETGDFAWELIDPNIVYVIDPPAWLAGTFRGHAQVKDLLRPGRLGVWTCPCRKRGRNRRPTFSRDIRVRGATADDGGADADRGAGEVRCPASANITTAQKCRFWWLTCGPAFAHVDQLNVNSRGGADLERKQLDPAVARAEPARTLGGALRDRRYRHAGRAQAAAVRLRRPGPPGRAAPSPRSESRPLRDRPPQLRALRPVHHHAEEHAAAISRRREGASGIT